MINSLTQISDHFLLLINLDIVKILFFIYIFTDFDTFAFLMAVWKECPGVTTNLHIGGALSTTGARKHRVHKRAGLPAPAAGQGQGCHEVLQERHEDQRHQCAIPDWLVLLIVQLILPFDLIIFPTDAVFR